MEGVTRGGRVAGTGKFCCYVLGRESWLGRLDYLRRCSGDDLSNIDRDDGAICG